MTRYMLNATKYILKRPKKHPKAPKFNKITLSTFSNPPLGLSTFLKLIMEGDIDRDISLAKNFIDIDISLAENYIDIYISLA